jgi:hypothetical protein
MRITSGSDRKWKDPPRYGSPMWIETPTLVAACVVLGAAAKANEASAAAVMSIRFI